MTPSRPPEVRYPRIDDEALALMDQIGSYTIERRLGSGAFATVWLGYDAGLDGHVAIKVLADNWSANADVKGRFLAEAKLLWRADDPRLVRVLAVGETDAGQPYFVMEHADRGTLADRLALRDEPMPLGDAIGLVEEIGACVSAVHRLSTLHRDVKPANLLIKSVTRAHHPVPGLAPDEVLLLADMGLAKDMALSSGITVAAGSPNYMAPEQAQPTVALDERVDVYALGVTAYEILTGEVPADRRSIGGVLPSGLDPSRLPSRLRPDLPAGIDTLLSETLASEPERRPRTVELFCTRLRDAVTTNVSQRPTAATPMAALRAPADPVVPGPVAGSGTSIVDATASNRARRWPVAAAIALAVMALVVGLVLVNRDAPAGEAADPPPATSDVIDEAAVDDPRRTALSRVEVPAGLDVSTDIETERDALVRIGSHDGATVDHCEAIRAEMERLGHRLEVDDCGDIVAITGVHPDTGVVLSFNLFAGVATIAATLP